MKPAWDKLMKEFANSKDALIGDVDCTAGGQSLCGDLGVKGYPTIKYGDPHNLEDYKGGRDFEALKKFASEKLGPTCGPANIGLCSAEDKALIEQFQKMPAAELETSIEDKSATIEKLETDFAEFQERLKTQYEEANTQKDQEIEDLKKVDVKLMKACQAHKKASVTEEL